MAEHALASDRISIKGQGGQRHPSECMEEGRRGAERRRTAAFLTRPFTALKSSNSRGIRDAENSMVWPHGPYANPTGMHARAADINISDMITASRVAPLRIRRILCRQLFIHTYFYSLSTR